MTKITCLTIAGSDPSGGAGLQADNNVFEKFGVRSFSVVTVVTSQSEEKFHSLYPVPSRVVTDQLNSLPKHNLSAIKIGMLYSLENILAVSEFLKTLDDAIPVVLDPIISSSTGYSLLEGRGLEVLVKEFLPLVNVITPNIDEAAMITGKNVKNTDDMKVAAIKTYGMIGTGRGKKMRCAIIKGGHLVGEKIDVVYDGGTHYEIKGTTLSKEMHGSGCRYSSALTASLATGSDIITAAQKAKNFVGEELMAKGTCTRSSPSA